MPIAAAQQALLGKTLYRDIWYDKPPLVPLIYLLWGAKISVTLRIVGALYCTLVCGLAYAVAEISVERPAKPVGPPSPQPSS